MYKDGMKEYSISLFHCQWYHGMIFKSFNLMKCLVKWRLEHKYTNYSPSAVITDMVTWYSVVLRKLIVTQLVIKFQTVMAVHIFDTSKF